MKVQVHGIPGLARAVAAMALGLAISACTPASPSPTSSALASASPAPSSTTAPSEPTAPADVGFATVVADRVNVREAPSLDAAVITQAIPDCGPCPPLQVGTATPYSELYLLKGPVKADGLDWYLAATAPEDAIFPEYIGWVAAGDASGAWLVLHAPDCPQPPIELTDITYAGLSRFEAIACFGGQPLTVRGWYVELPADAETNGDCSAEPAWLVCGFGYHMLRPEPSGYYGDASNLPMKVDPSSSVQMPPRGNWVLVTGMFDHPSAQACGTDAEDQIAFRLQCRMEFVVTEAHLTP